MRATLSAVQNTSALEVCPSSPFFFSLNVLSAKRREKDGRRKENGAKLLFDGPKFNNFR
jgi:hypothetical protein